MWPVFHVDKERPPSWKSLAVVEELDTEGGRDSFLEGYIHRGGSRPFDLGPDLMVDGVVQIGWGWGTLAKKKAWAKAGRHERL